MNLGAHPPTLRGHGWFRHRWVEPVAVCALFLGALAIYYPEVLFRGRTFLPLGFGYGGVMGLAGPWGFEGAPRPDPYRWDRGASSWQIEPQAREVAQSYAAGELPLWNPHQGFGAPLAANAQSGAFDLLRLPAFLNSSPLGWDAYYLGRVLLGLLLAYLLARELQLAFLARAAFSIGYVFSGFMLIMGNNHFVAVYLLLPGLLWATERVQRGHVTAGGLVVVTFVALSALVGMPEVTLMCFLYASAWAGFRVLGAARARQAQWRSRTAALVSAWLIGLGLAAPMILPLAEYIDESFNIHTPDLQLGRIAQPLAELAYLGIPYVRGLPGSGVLQGEPIGVKNYVGATVLLLAAVGALAPCPRLAAGARRFALGAVVLLGSKFFGLPLVNDLGGLPGLDVTLVADWGGPLLSFSLVLLAAVGIDALTRQPRRVHPVALAASLGMVGLYLALALMLQRDVLARAGWEHWRATAGVALGAAAVAWLLVVSARWLPIRVGAGLAVGLMAAELVFLAPRGNYQDRYDPLSKPPFVEYLQQRVAGEPARIFATNALLSPNLATAFHLDDVRALDALYPRRYLEYVRNFITPVYDRYLGRPTPGVEGDTRLDNNVWLDLANVRFVIQPSPEQPGSRPGGPDGPEPVYAGEVVVYEKATAFPRAFLVPVARPVKTASEAVAVMREPGFNPATTVVVEGAVPDAMSAANPSPGSGISRAAATITSYAAGQVSVAVTAPRDAMLVLSDTWFPGWVARVDGQSTPLLPANLAFRAVAVPAGQHTVIFAYDPGSVRAGLGLTAASLLALLAFLVVTTRRQVRRAMGAGSGGLLGLFFLGGGDGL